MLTIEEAKVEKKLKEEEATSYKVKKLKFLFKVIIIIPKT